MSNSDSVSSLVSGPFVVVVGLGLVVVSVVVVVVEVVVVFESVLTVAVAVLAVLLAVLLAVVVVVGAVEVGLALVVEFGSGMEVDFALENSALYLFKVILFVPYSNVPLPWR